MENSFSFKLLNTRAAVVCLAKQFLCYPTCVSFYSSHFTIGNTKTQHTHTQIHNAIHAMWNESELKLSFNVSMYAMLSKHINSIAKICVSASNTIANKLAVLAFACLSADFAKEKFNFILWTNWFVLIITSTHTHSPHTHTHIDNYIQPTNSSLGPGSMKIRCWTSKSMFFSLSHKLTLNSSFMNILLTNKAKQKKNSIFFLLCLQFHFMH